MPGGAGNGHSSRNGRPIKTLYLLRHADTVPHAAGSSDFDRPLTPHGRRSAEQLGQIMSEAGLVPAMVLSSTAQRAIETWHCLCPLRNDDFPFVAHQGLYLADPERILSVLAELTVPTNPVLLIGHNPGIETLAAQLAGRAWTARTRKQMMPYPLLGLAVFEFFAERWADIESAESRLVRFLRPPDMAEG